MDNPSWDATFSLKALQNETLILHVQKYSCWDGLGFTFDRAESMVIVVVVTELALCISAVVM